VDEIHTSLRVCMLPLCNLRTMCGSRTGGWSLPCVMSDCRCRFGLTGVGAGEEQARMVVADEASKCGEDK
jgi:hypothetical protein